MSRRKKFEKLEYNQAYIENAGGGATEEKSVLKEENAKKAKPKKNILSGKLPGIDVSKAPEKITPSTRFTYSRFTKSSKKKETSELKAPSTAPLLLMLIAFLLLFLAERVLDLNGFENLFSSNVVTAKTIINVVVYLVPALVYIFSSPNRKKKYYFKGFSASVVPFAVSMLFFTVFFTALQKYFMAYNFSYSVEVGTSSNDIFAVLITGAVLPAVFEELFVHGIFQHEVSKYAGGLCGIVTGAVVFAMLQFDINYFVVYFFTGVVMGSITHVTGSVFPAMIVRFVASAVSILLSDRVTFIAVERIGGTLLMIILAVFCFVFLIVALRVAERISDKRAAEALKAAKHDNAETQEAESENDEPAETKKTVDEDAQIYLVAGEGRSLARFGRVVTSPYVLGMIVVFVVEILLELS